MDPISTREQRLAGAAESIRTGTEEAIAATRGWQSDGIPAPHVGIALGALSGTVALFDPLLEQLLVGLQHSHREVGHVDDRAGDPDAAVAAVRSSIQVAQELLAAAQVHLAEADAITSYLRVAPAEEMAS